MVYNRIYQNTISILLFKAIFRYNLEIKKILLPEKHKAKVAILKSKKLIVLYIQLSFNIKFLNKRIAFYIDKKQSQKPLFKKRNRVYLFYKNLKTK